MATVPAQRTWTAGELVDATMLNTNVRDAVNFLLTNKPHAQLYKTATQSLTNSTWTDVTWPVEEYDNDGGHSTSSNTNRYVAQTAGKYMVSGALAFTTNASGTRGIRLVVNGSLAANAIAGTQVLVSTSSGFATCIHMSASIVTLGVGEWVGMQAWQSSGGALTLVAEASGEGCRMTIMYVGT